MQLRVDGVEHAPGRLRRLLDRVLAVLQHLGLDDRHDPRLLAQRRVARQRVGVRPDAVLARPAAADGVGRAPLREARAEPAVLLEPLAQPVQPLGDRLGPVGQRERLRAQVDLDSGYDAAPLEQLRERGPVRRALPDGLVVEDDAADVLLDAFRAEEEVAVGATVLLGGLDSDGVEPLLDRARALVGGEDALALGHDRAGGRVHVVLAHRLPP